MRFDGGADEDGGPAGVDAMEDACPEPCVSVNEDGLASLEATQPARVSEAIDSARGAENGQIEVPRREQVDNDAVGEAQDR